MKRKQFFIISFFILSIFISFFLYQTSSKRFKIVNTTENKINNLKIVQGVNENTQTIETFSIDKYSTKTLKLPTNDNKITILYSYDNNQSSESFVIRNDQLEVNFSKLIINSIDSSQKINAELK